eukprot:CAMPEP_0179029934 /NCGR_PEP_ID=MMETSP0796-20121207/10311_1 /TAXON_ID=73915 /ORGANISM="Pyrodinium bahamense, Strain pbaha01" /LENGTH=184 /DNA_ID=CAMNT_0020726111 /DNA_START=43 /DNA_END=597 /DNA_ORIENTATION=+
MIRWRFFDLLGSKDVPVFLGLRGDSLQIVKQQARLRGGPGHAKQTVLCLLAQQQWEHVAFELPRPGPLAAVRQGHVLALCECPREDVQRTVRHYVQPCVSPVDAQILAGLLRVLARRQHSLRMQLHGCRSGQRATQAPSAKKKVPQAAVRRDRMLLQGFDDVPPDEAEETPHASVHAERCNVSA